MAVAPWRDRLRATPIPYIQPPHQFLTPIPLIPINAIYNIYYWYCGGLYRCTEELAAEIGKPPGTSSSVGQGTWLPCCPCMPRGQLQSARCRKHSHFYYHCHWHCHWLPTRAPGGVSLSLSLHCHWLQVPLQVATITALPVSLTCHSLLAAVRGARGTPKYHCPWLLLCGVVAPQARSRLGPTTPP